MLGITTRTLLGAAALAVSTAVAGAQAPQDSTTRRTTASPGVVERDADRAATRATTRRACCWIRCSGSEPSDIR